MKYAFEDQRAGPYPAQLIDIRPGHRRVKQRGHPPGQRLDVSGLVRPHIVAEGDASDLAAHAPQPLRLECHAGQSGNPETWRYGEAIANVALAVAEKLIVDGQNECVIAGFRGALGELAGKCPVPVDEYLHPARRGSTGRNILERRHRAVAQAEAGAGPARGARQAALAVRPEKPREACRTDHDRQAQLLAEERN